MRVSAESGPPSSTGRHRHITECALPPSRSLCSSNICPSGRLRYRSAICWNDDVRNGASRVWRNMQLLIDEGGRIRIALCDTGGQRKLRACVRAVRDGVITTGALYDKGQSTSCETRFVDLDQLGHDVQLDRTCGPPVLLGGMPRVHHVADAVRRELFCRRLTTQRATIASLSQ